MKNEKPGRIVQVIKYWKSCNPPNMKTEEEIKTASADTHLQIWVTCPYCGEYQNRLDELREHLDYGELRAENCEAEIRCEECQKIFIVNEISY